MKRHWFKLNSWWKSFLTGVLATAIGVGLTFEVNNRVEHHRRYQARYQAAIMAIYDIDEIIRQFLADKEQEDALFKVAMYLYTHQEELERTSMDSLWMTGVYLNKASAEMPKWADDSSERVFTSSMDVLQDLGDIVFYDNVQECYLQRRNMLRRMKEDVTFRRPISSEFVLEYRKHVPAANMDYNGMMNKVSMAGLIREMFRQPEVPLYLQKYLARDREYFRFLNELIRLNQENKYIMNISDADMASYVEKHINKTMAASAKRLVGEWEQRQNNEQKCYSFRQDCSVSLVTQMDYRIGVYVEEADVNVYMLAPLRYTIDGEWRLEGDSLCLVFDPEGLEVLSFDLDFSYLPKSALAVSKDSLECTKQRYQESIQQRLRSMQWRWVNKVSLSKSGSIMFWAQDYTMPWGQTVTEHSQLLRARGK